MQRMPSGMQLLVLRQRFFVSINAVRVLDDAPRFRRANLTPVRPGCARSEMKAPMQTATGAREFPKHSSPFLRAAKGRPQLTADRPSSA